MQRDDDRNEERGTILEPLEAIDAILAEHAAHRPSAPGGHHTLLEPPLPTTPPAAVPPPVPAAPVSAMSQVQEDLFRPVSRPAVPRLTILDDGDATQGEVVRIREPVTLIGRTEGAVRLPHDPLVSGRHAEIVRDGAAAPYRWVLRDLGSSNGTFVRCDQTVLRPDRLIILGSRRYRFRVPAAAAAATADMGTMVMDTRQMLQSAVPALVETTRAGVPEIPLSKPMLSIGRPGCGNDIEIDDPLLAPYHAHVIRQPSGEWQLQATRSKNGVWVQISAMRLAHSCRFQCGEQRFLFVV